MCFFLNWTVDNDRLPENPLRRLKKISLSGNERRKRRALTPDEVHRLLAVVGEYRPVFAMAVYTGLRRNELESLQWGDLCLDKGAAAVRPRASTTKNRKSEPLPILEPLAELLRSIRPAGASACGKVFPKIPCMPRLMKYWELAGIPYRDEQGRVADFHSLRVTYGTEMLKNGAPARYVQEAMRHSSIELTTRIYTDTHQLPMASAIAKLPNYLEGLPQILPQNLDATSPEMATAGTVEPPQSIVEHIAPDMVRHSVAQTVINNQMVREGGLEPPCLAALEPKSSASANSAIPAGSQAAFNMFDTGGNASMGRGAVANASQAQRIWFSAMVISSPLWATDGRFPRYCWQPVFLAPPILKQPNEG